MDRKWLCSCQSIEKPYMLVIQVCHRRVGYSAAPWHTIQFHLIHGPTESTSYNTPLGMNLQRIYLPAMLSFGYNFFIRMRCDAFVCRHIARKIPDDNLFMFRLCASMFWSMLIYITERRFAVGAGIAAVH